MGKDMKSRVTHDNISMYDLFETYPHFETRSWMVNGGDVFYNAVNGVPACASSFLSRRASR